MKNITKKQLTTIVNEALAKVKEGFPSPIGDGEEEVEEEGWQKKDERGRVYFDPEAIFKIKGGPSKKQVQGPSDES